MRELLEFIDEVLTERRRSARQVSIEAIGTPNLITDMHRGQVPSIDRLRALCEVLGLEFYVGRARSVSPSNLSFDSSSWNQARTLRIDAQQDGDSADENLRVQHTIAQAGLTVRLRNTPVRITDDDDGESLIGSRPAAANVWWAATPARGTCRIRHCHNFHATWMAGSA